MNAFQDAFISYGRIDSKQFAKQLNDRLVELGYEVWFDFEDIPLGVDYQRQIDDGIERSDNFIFIISPHSASSAYCQLEIEQALRHRKRIIPLLHVAEISRETWQERHPQGTDDQWAEYTAAGKHASRSTMHPEIRKINWVYFRAGIDDFETSLQGLLELLERQKDYVRQHTVLLQGALEWERNQRQNRYLPIGEERHQAEAWLKTRFLDSQPPCYPTDLHYEFITESIKNANNLMTQVFLCHAEEDSAMTEKVRRTLMQAGITTWTYRSDIEFGGDFKAAIARGIEEADNVLFLMSPHGLQSQYCQQEIDLALQLHKRLIVMLAATVDADQIPPALRNRQYIDLTDNQTEADYLKDNDNLLRVLQQDAAYHHEHKVLLTKALKWERQQRNPSVLLRGYELQHALAWLKLAKQYPNYSPIGLQQEFIAASERQPAGLCLDVFISYSRADADFARQLNDGLQRQGKRTWFDQESIASGADFQQEIYRGIEASDHFLFVLSPRSVNSPFCTDEVEYAAKLNKRFVTVRYQAVEGSDLHPELAKVQWVDFQANHADFAANFKELIRTLDADPDHLRFHTRLLMQAIAWDEKGRRESLLLRGDELTEAEQWLLRAAGKQPSPIELQGEYVAASRKTATGQQRRRVGLLGIVLVLATLGSATWVGQRRAQQIAVGRLLTSQVLVLQARTDQLPQQVLLAIEATQRLADHDLSAADANPGLRDLRLLPTQGISLSDGINAVAFSPDGKTLAIGRQDGQVSVRHLETDQELPPIEGENEVSHLIFSPGGEILAIGREGGQVQVVDLESNRDISRIAYGLAINSIAFSPDGKAVAIAGENNNVLVWNLDEDRELKTLRHDQDVNRAVFSPDGQLLATANEDGTARVWRIDTGQQVDSSQFSDQVKDVVFNSDGETLAAASLDGTITVRDWQANQTLETLEQGEPLQTAVFSPNRNTLATANEDGTVLVWNLQNRQPIASIPHEAEGAEMVFSSAGNLLATWSEGTVRVWNLAFNQEVARITQDGAIAHVALSPDNQTLATVADDGTAQLWHLTAPPELTLLPYNNIVNAAVSQDGQSLVTVGKDGAIVVWNLATQTEIARVVYDKGVNDVALSPDGTLLAIASNDGELFTRNLETQQEVKFRYDAIVNRLAFSPGHSTAPEEESPRLATAGRDNTARLWDLKTGEEKESFEHDAWVNDVAFSPDGKTLATASGQTARLWLIGTGAEKKPPLQQEARVAKVVFSPNGKTLITGSQNGVIQKWSLETNRRTSSTTYDARENGMVLSPNGSVLATTSGNTVRVWDLKAEQELARVTRYRPVAVALGGDGNTLAIVDSDGTVEVSIIGPDKLVDTACGRLTRNLTLTEWQKYVGKNIPYHRTCENLPAPADKELQPPSAGLRLPDKIADLQRFLSSLL